jgi:hypothetical protein
MTSTMDLAPISGPLAWRGDELSKSTEWIYLLNDAERTELEEVGRKFLNDDPDLRTVTPDQYPLPVCAPAIARWGADMDAGRGFVLVRGLRTHEYSDALSGSIFFIVGLHLGVPMRQNEVGDVIDHIIATSTKSMDDPTAVPSRIRDKLVFHSDSSDVVSLMCLRPSKSGGASSLVSGATLYNEVLRRRPDLAPRLFDEYHWDGIKQDPDAPANTYTSPMASYVDGVFSFYAGSSMIFTGQAYPDVPPLTQDQIDVINLVDEITYEPGVALDMDFQPGDMQWLLNYAALHSRTEFTDYPEIQRRRHLLRLWLRRDVGRPLTGGFGRNSVVKDRATTRQPNAADVTDGKFHVTEAVIPRMDWGS